MFRSQFRFAATMFGLMTLLFSAPALCPAQDPNPPQQKPSPVLWKLLSDWAAGSANIKTLSGQHERHVYDDTFFVEKVSNGKFFYEGPDKGRIDISAIQITPDMIARRDDPDARVERKPNGDPYDLKSDDPAKWVCDGSRVFEIDDPQKQARIVNLPPNLRGENIMNSPLPFLFGLPPEDALERFNMTLEKDGRPEHNYVLLSATPRLRQDADNWSSAEIYLNTETFLPIAVKLVDPPKTKRTVYKFIDTKINRNEMIAAIMRNKPFEPNLRGYQIQMIQPGAGNADGPQGDVAQNKPVMNPSEDPQAAQVVPDVVGQPHHIAEKMLLAAGVEQGSIRKFKGQPAPRENLKFIVSNQKPAPGTPLAEAAEVHLLIFVEPAAAAPGAAAIQPANGIQR